MYSQFENFTFLISNESGFGMKYTHVVQAYNQGGLALLMTRKKENGYNETCILIYGLNFTKHNTFILFED